MASDKNGYCGRPLARLISPCMRSRNRKQHTDSRSGKEYKVTRTYKTNLQFLAESWIGTDGFATE